MTETLATFLAVLSLWCLSRFDAARTCFNAAMAGGAIGLAVLCRPTFLPWLVLVGLVMLLICGGPPIVNPKSKIHNLPSFSSRVINVAGLAVVAGAVISPWAIRNYLSFCKPIVTKTHGGYTFYLGNNASFYDWLVHNDNGLPWDARELQAQLWSKWASQPGWFRRSEPEFDDFCYRAAAQTINSDRSLFWRACAYRLG